MINPPAIVEQIADFGRCRCPQCLFLDAMFPGQGYQLALFPYVISTAPPQRRTQLKLRAAR